jgi:hypothetical protein
VLDILAIGWFVDAFVIVGLSVVLGSIVLFWMGSGRRARRFGYESTGAYLRAAPRSDPEKRDAADLVLKGLVFCVMGMFFSPFVLVGVLPLFYGGRKLAYASMGLGLVDDADQPGA